MQKARLVAILLFLCVSSFVCSAQSASEEPLPPPVDIAIISPESARPGQEISLTITITAQEAMHVDISCALPDDIDLRYAEGLRVTSTSRQIQRILRKNDVSFWRTSQAVGLFTGHLEKNQQKVFFVHVIARHAGTYQIACIVDALAVWGEKASKHTLQVM